MKTGFPLLAFTLLLAGCGGWFGDKETPPLAGDRAPILPTSANEQLKLEQGESLTSIVLPPVTANKVWSQNMGYPSHNPTHLSFATVAPRKVWGADLGEGISKKAPLVASPVIANNTIYASDTRGVVSAYTLDSGKRLWRAGTLGKEQEKNDIIAGGGLAYGRNMIFASNGSRDLVALNATNGQVLWRTQAKAALRGAPTTLGGRVYIIDAVNNVMAMDAVTGKEIWSHKGAEQDIAVLGIPSPALTSDALVTGLSDGSIVALSVKDGKVLWRSKFNRVRGGRIDDLNNLRDVIAPPVIQGNSVLSSNAAGLVMSTNAFTGQRQWQKDIGANGVVWTSGNALFILTHTGLSARDLVEGLPIWNLNLPQFEDEQVKEDPIKWFGPYVLSERLYAFNDDGKSLIFNPIDGTQIAVIDIPANIAVRPIVANNMIAFVTEDGQLSVWK